MSVESEETTVGETSDGPLRYSLRSALITRLSSRPTAGSRVPLSFHPHPALGRDRCAAMGVKIERDETCE